MPPSIPSLPAGHMLNEYRIASLLGVGGFGLTYLATDENLNLPVAIKEYLPSELANRNADFLVSAKDTESKATFDWGLARFMDEARTLATFRHPNIVRVMRFFQVYQTAYMVMEFVQGSSLSDWIKSQRPVSAKQIREVIEPLVEGLGVIHAAGYLHRDVKPGNIYMRQDGTPVLLDFGAARATVGGAEMTAIVSPGYAPVEQYSESSVQGPWSDLYAVGGVMYWMATGTKPVDATARLRNDPQPKALDIGDRARYGEPLLSAIDWALTPDERERPQSAAEFLARLRGQAGFDASEWTKTVPFSQTRTLPAGGRQSIETTRAPTVPLDEDQLKQVENELAHRIGPLAAVLVRKAAKKHAGIDELIASLAGEIDNDADRASFTQRARGITQPPSAGRMDRTEIATRMATARFELPVLERAEKRLAQHIGAVARVIVKRAAMRARDESELYLIIADEIADPEERKAFVKKAIQKAGSGPA